MGGLWTSQYNPRYKENLSVYSRSPELFSANPFELYCQLIPPGENRSETLRSVTHFDRSIRFTPSQQETPRHLPFASENSEVHIHDAKNRLSTIRGLP